MLWLCATLRPLRLGGEIQNSGTCSEAGAVAQLVKARLARVDAVLAGLEIEAGRDFGDGQFFAGVRGVPVAGGAQAAIAEAEVHPVGALACGPARLGRRHLAHHAAAVGTAVRCGGRGRGR